MPFGFYPYYYGPFGGYGYGYGYPYGYGYGYGLGSALRHARRRRSRTRAVVRDGVVVAVPADEVPINEDLPVATAVDEEDREALLEEDASPPPTQSDDALSALHAFLFGGPGAKSADHWRRVAAVVADLCGNQPVS